jgi:hypothetical protein
LADAAGKPVCAHRWARSVTVSTTPCAVGALRALECELLDRTTFKTQTQARIASFEFIEE